MTDVNTNLPVTSISYVIYALCIGIVIATIIMLVDNFYPFLPINPVSGPSAAARAGVTFWPTNAENLIVPAAQSPTVSTNVYSLSVQVMIGDSRTPSLGKFRHILHRGSSLCGVGASTAGPSGHAGIQAADCSGDYSDTGLPAIMNPGLFLDQYKNDIHVFVHTTATDNGKNIMMLESLTLSDLPLQVPINLGVICNGNALEVYVNCRLHSTILLKGTPYLPSTDRQWVGRGGAFPMSGIVQNLTLWGSALGSSDYIQMCRSPSMNKGDLPTPAVCN